MKSHPIVLSREEFLIDARKQIGPWGFHEEAARGRRIEEVPDPLRTDVQRDRDRIIHSAAFRRLNGKTQVFVSDTGDHYRTRLTHSLEVSQIARSMARSLRLNEDLVEVLALAHDLGHAPFGHSGGEVLNLLMRNHGGFEHNHQSLRIVDELEHRYPRFKGLNLCYEVRESILKHNRPFDGPAYDSYHREEGPLLEAQVVDIADGIAYMSADLDDGLRAELLDEPRLHDEVSLWRRAKEMARAHHPEAEGRLLRLKVVAELIALLVRDAVRETSRRLQEHGVKSIDAVRAQSEPLVAFSDEIRREEYELRGHLYENFYTHYKVCRMRHRAKEVIQGLFTAYLSSPELMPPRFQELAQKIGLERALADYISGMTDGYAQKEFGLLFQPGGGSLDP